MTLYIPRIFIIITMAHCDNASDNARVQQQRRGLSIRLILLRQMRQLRHVFLLFSTYRFHKTSTKNNLPKTRVHVRFRYSSTPKNSLAQNNDFHICKSLVFLINNHESQVVVQTTCREVKNIFIALQMLTLYFVSSCGTCSNR